MSTNPRRTLRDTTAGILLAASAGVMGAVLLGGGAEAGVVSQSGSLTLLTSEATNEDVVLVLDARAEEIFVYRTDVNQGIDLVQRIPLAGLFQDARARFFGRE
jgi:hypothetical protein